MIRTLYRNAKGNFSIDIPNTHWRTALKDESGLLWVDFQGEAIETAEPLLKDIFKFHPLAIDDALRENHVPKIDNWREAVYVCVHNVVFDTKSLALVTNELDIFFGRNFLVSLHHEPVEAVDRIWRHTQSNHTRLEAGPDHLLYDLLDTLTSDYMPVADALDETIDSIEEEVFDNPTQKTLNKIFSVRRAVLKMRRIISPQREVLNRLARDEYPFIDPKDRVYFRDVYDHLVRLADLNESLRDLIGGTLDTYLSVIANRQNAIMKTLTITSVLFLPISFLAGFFGMNFVNMPFGNDGWMWGVGLAMILVPVIMLSWFRWRNWL
ncbi:MAG: magnesium/cobalt transporter CorA [Anaerolineales bacterium]|nr:magnesium/cobalt transporter CorA [Anaerolineales bacterium]